jgi:hypothetical protein
MQHSLGSWAGEGTRPSCRILQVLPFAAGSGPSWASAAASVKWGRGLCSWSLPALTPCAHPDPTLWVRIVLGLRRPDRRDPRQLGACDHTAARPGGSGPRAGPGKRQGPRQLPWRACLLAGRSCPATPAGADLRSRNLSLGDAADSRPRRPALGCGGGGRRAESASSDDRERAPAPRRTAPALPAPSVSSAAGPRSGPILGSRELP